MKTEHSARLSILAIGGEVGETRPNRMILEKAGYHVDTALGAGQAMARLAKEGYPIVLVDLALPDSDGLEFLSNLRNPDPHAVTIVLADEESPKSAVGAIKAGAYDYLIKPCAPEILLSSVHRAAERYSLSLALTERTGELEAANRELDRRVRDATHEIFSLNEKLQRTVEELTETNRLQTRFMEDMTHELKNPLSVIWGYVSFLLKQPETERYPMELERALQNIQRNAGHLHAMIEEMMDAARLDSHKLVLKKETFLARDAAIDAVESLRIQAEEKGLTLTAECDPVAAIPINADSNRLRQVLINLIANAIKFTPKGGHVTVRSRVEEGSQAHFCVKDTGPGIEAKDLKRIFDRFYQAHDPQHRHKGLGLGLHIAQSLIALHGGRIWAESEVDVGSQFHFTLPYSASPGKTSPAKETKKTRL